MHLGVYQAEPCQAQAPVGQDLCFAPDSTSYPCHWVSTSIWMLQLDQANDSGESEITEASLPHCLMSIQSV